MSTFIPFTSDVEVIAICHGLVNRTLPKINWTHAAHFATALCLIETGAGSTVPAVIRAYNESIGVANTGIDAGCRHISKCAEAPATISSLQRPIGVVPGPLRLVTDLLVARGPLLHRSAKRVGGTRYSPLAVLSDPITNRSEAFSGQTE